MAMLSDALFFQPKEASKRWNFS